MKRADKKRITDKLAKDNVCYVLITCAEPSDDGDMQVEMSYEGDASLASYLLQGAQNFFDDQDDEKQDGCAHNKIMSING